MPTVKRSLIWWICCRIVDGTFSLPESSRQNASSSPISLLHLDARIIGRIVAKVKRKVRTQIADTRLGGARRIIGMKAHFDFRQMQPRLRRPEQSPTSSVPKPALELNAARRRRRERSEHFGLLEILGRFPG